MFPKYLFPGLPGILGVILKVYFKQTSLIGISVTRLGNLLHFGQLFKACGNIYLAQITHVFRQFL